MKLLILLLSLVAINANQLSHAAEAVPATNFKILSFNIDTNILRTEEGYARDSHPEWRVGNRMPKIQAALTDIVAEHKPDVVQIQEGRDFTTVFGDRVDSVTPVMDTLRVAGYQVNTTQYNPSDRAFSYITAVKPDFTIDGHQKLYLTKTPDVPTDHRLPIAEVKANNFGSEWERCVYITSFHDIHGRQYRVKNVHLDLGLEQRKAACEILRRDSEAAVAANPALLEASTGDFNSFPDWGGPEQGEIMVRGGAVQEVTADLRLSNGKPVSSTFIAFPYDFAANENRLRAQIKREHGVETAAFLAGFSAVERKKKIGELYDKECQALGGHLDRVYQHGFRSARATLLPTPQFADFDLASFGEDHVKNYVLRHHHDGPAFASDHQPVLAHFELPS